MSIKWTEDLSTGVDEIDDQHRELIERINKLFDACRAGTEKAEVLSALEFLADYVVTHFRTEERKMSRHYYPDYDAHKAQHDEFKAVVRDLKARIDREGVALATVTNLNHLLVDWLVKHIRRSDKAMGQFLKSKIAPAKTK